MRAVVAGACFAMCLGTSFAVHADEPPTLESAAALSAEGSYAECGKSYLEVAGNLGESPKAADALLAGALCFEKAKLIGLAIVALNRLTTKHPTSKQTPRALLWLASLNESIAFFARAADRYEDFAKKFPSNAEAPIAVSRAIELRRGLGQTKRAIRLLDTLIKKYARKRPTQVADAVLTKVDLHMQTGSQVRAERALNDYLKTFAKTGGDQAASRIHSRLGRLLWDRSCSSSSGGLCVKRRRSKAKSCTSSALPVTVARPRKTSLASKAKKHLETAIKLGGKTDGKSAWIVGASLALADATLEENLGTSMPVLRFAKSSSQSMSQLQPQSTRAFQQWLRKRTELGTALGERYAKLVKERRGRFSQVAARRIGQLAEGFAAELATAPMPTIGRRVPADLARDIEKAYCGALEDVTAPLIERAVSAYQHCFASGDDPQVTKACELGLLRLSPKTFASNDERVHYIGAAGDMATHIDILETKSTPPSSASD